MAVQMTVITRHLCHRPGCTTPVPPKLVACRPHWFELPRDIRDAIWDAYVPGQEVRKDPSDEYLAVMGRAQAYWTAVDQWGALEPEGRPSCREFVAAILAELDR